MVVDVGRRLLLVTLGADREEVLGGLFDFLSDELDLFGLGDLLTLVDYFVRALPGLLALHVYHVVGGRGLVEAPLHIPLPFGGYHVDFPTSLLSYFYLLALKHLIIIIPYDSEQNQYKNPQILPNIT